LSLVADICKCNEKLSLSKKNANHTHTHTHTQFGCNSIPAQVEVVHIESACDMFVHSVCRTADADPRFV